MGVPVDVLPDAAASSTAAVGPDGLEGLDIADAATTSLGGAELRELRHEVANALTSASGYAQFLLRKLPSWADERDRRALQGIADSVARACDVLERGRSGRTAACLCDLADLLEAAAQEVPSERWPDVRVRVCGKPLIGRWDAGRLAQVLANLLLNAAKYSPAGTPIEVEATRLGTHNWARVIVRDHGIGIEDDALETIFDGRRTPRAERTAPGSGVGLRLSRKLVEAEGGLLWAMNVPEGGSAFYLELPLVEIPLSDTGPASDPRDELRQHRRGDYGMALVVEDDPWTRCLLGELLDRAGFTVVQASNGFTGARLAAQLQPDLILLDLCLPEHAGLDVLHTLKHDRPTCRIPVIVVSGSTALLQADDLQQADAVVQKPFANDTLLAEVERVLQSPRSPAAANGSQG